MTVEQFEAGTSEPAERDFPEPAWWPSEQKALERLRRRRRTGPDLAGGSGGPARPS